MDSNDYFDEMKKIQKNILDYLDYESNAEEKYQNIKMIFDDIQIHDNRYKIKSLMHLLVHISNNHHREEGFFSKIEQILSLFKEDLKKKFTNSEIFNIFKSNKRILLYLSEEKIFEFDEFIVKRIVSAEYGEPRYPHYFQPEVEPFKNEPWFPKFKKGMVNSLSYIFQTNKWMEELKDEIPEGFYEKRKIGENDDVICNLIRKDLIEEFIIYVNKNNCRLDAEIDLSNYETNSFLLTRNKVSLIEYATFFGSTQIFKYLYKNDVQLASSLWIYAVHGKDEEIFHCLEENNVLLPELSYKELFKESIKCHHIDFANYIQNNYLTNENEEEDEKYKGNSYFEMIESLKYYNFIFIQNDKISDKVFNYLCGFDYYIPVLNLLNTKDIDVNMRAIKKKKFE